MNSGQRSAVVLLLASAVAAYEQHAREDASEIRPTARVDAAMEAEESRPGRLMMRLLARALGREQRTGLEPGWHEDGPDQAPRLNGTDQALVLSSSCRSRCAASSISLWRHSAARYWQAIRPVRCTRRKSP